MRIFEIGMVVGMGHVLECFYTYPMSPDQMYK